MGPKGKSLAEKEAIILRIYHNAKEPFNLKEIERDGAKQGVVQQSIKDVNQTLVHDGKVQTDKMGSGNFFWSFPSKELQDRKSKKEQLTRQRDLARIQANASQEAVTAAETSRNASDRPTKIRRLEQLAAEEARLDLVFEQNKKNDPLEIARVVKSAKMTQAAASRWTDNVWALKSYLVKKRNMESKVLIPGSPSSSSSPSPSSAFTPSFPQRHTTSSLSPTQ